MTTTSIPDYQAFLHRKSQEGADHGFDPHWLPEQMFDFQRDLTTWAIRKGRGALIEDTGLGKSLQELTWAHNVVRETNKPVLLLTPLAVTAQMAREAEKFGIDAHVARDGIASSGINITNYERLHHFDWQDFDGVVCDESSVLKSYSGQRRKDITRFMAKIPYRLLATATAAPNDWVELGTSSEAVGDLSHSDMLKRFFAQKDDKGQKGEQRRQDEAEKIIAHDPSYYQKLSYRVSQSIGQWRLKHHAVDGFWRWVASWARAARLPSDLGYDDGDYILPPLIEKDHIIKTGKPPEGYLFAMPAFGLQEEREERRRTLQERCEYAARLVDHDRPAVIWCQMNAEGDLLEKIIPDAVQVAGRTPDERKVEIYEAFSSGHQRVVVIKPKIGAWGLNWQHCRHVVTFATHSFEQYYQAARRCWRYGQKQPVQLDVIATEGEERVLANMRAKGRRADEMFSRMVAAMHNAESIERTNHYTQAVEVPSWL